MDDLFTLEDLDLGPTTSDRASSSREASPPPPPPGVKPAGAGATTRGGAPPPWAPPGPRLSPGPPTLFGSAPLPSLARRAIVGSPLGVGQHPGARPARPGGAADGDDDPGLPLPSPSLRSSLWARGEDDCDEEECSICLEAYSADDPAVFTACRCAWVGGAWAGGRGDRGVRKKKGGGASFLGDA